MDLCERNCMCVCVGVCVSQPTYGFVLCMLLYSGCTTVGTKPTKEEGNISNMNRQKHNNEQRNIRKTNGGAHPQLYLSKNNTLGQILMGNPLQINQIGHAIRKQTDWPVIFEPAE